MANIRKIKNKKLNRLQLGIFISVVAIILVAAFFFFKPQTSKINPQDSRAVARKESQDKFIEADKAVTDGDYAKGQAILDDALKNKIANAERSYVYVQKSTLASNSSKTEDSITFAKKAEELDPTRLSATVLAQVAERSGDKVLALKYYELVVARTTEREQRLSPDDFIYFQSKVKELGGI
ncbi:hypothetical protein H7X69_01610 [Candidatus Saccharibacteria bacterium]|nr:hypothetical protein [Candidatus Saccharibacteria bacterium]